MEAYEKRLRREILILYGVIVLLLVIMVVVGVLDSNYLFNSRQMGKLAEGSSRLIFFGSLIAVIVRIHRLKKLLADRLERKAQKTLDDDERRQFLSERSSAWTVRIMLVLLAAATFFLSYINQPAFYTAYAALACMLAVKGVLWLILKRKY